MQKNHLSKFSCAPAIAPQIVTADVTGAAIDGQGAQSLSYAIYVGAPGDTLSSSVKVDVKLLESDDNETFAPVADADKVIGATPDANGVVATIDGAADASKQYRIAYVGDARYTRVDLDVTGTHTNGTPFAVTAIKGDLEFEKE